MIFLSIHSQFIKVELIMFYAQELPVKSYRSNSLLQQEIYTDKRDLLKEYQSLGNTSETNSYLYQTSEVFH